MNVKRRWYRSLPRWLCLSVTALIITFAGAQQAWSGCFRGALNCTGMDAMRTCSAAVTCFDQRPPTSEGPRPISGWALIHAGSTHITACLPSGRVGMGGSMVTFMIQAMAPTAYPDPRCSWDWITADDEGANGRVSIGPAGLPVELMEFSVGLEED